MKIIFLGTNGWFTTPTGNTPCILIDSKEGYTIFDAGNGIYKLDQYIKEEKPISLFISHFHLDHVNGLHILSKFKFPQGIDIYIAEGRKKDFDTLFNPPFTVGYINKPENINQLGMEVRFHELPEGENVIRQFHGYTDHGYRVTLEGKVIAYSGDCGISEGSRILAKDADLLIHESSFVEAPKEDRWGHVDAVQAASLAKEAGVKKLILTHFDASKFTSLDLRKIAEKKAQEIFPETTAAFDDLTVEL